MKVWPLFITICAYKPICYAYLYRDSYKVFIGRNMHENRFFNMAQRLILCLLMIESLHIAAADKQFDSGSRMQTISTVAGTSALIVSTAQGIYNIRRYHFMMAQYQLDYNLSSPIFLIEYPLQAVQNLICSGLPALDMEHQNQYGLAVKEIAKKIAVFDGVDPATIWDFEKFRTTMPHTSIKEAYCISKSYLGCFGYPTLGVLKSSVAYQISKIEKDFKQLTNLTDLPWYFVKIPKNLADLYQLENQLAKFSHYYGGYALLGAFGYSCIHNGNRVKNYLITLAKMHAFLLNFQELLATCMDSDETSLIQSQGALQFSLQHVHHVEHRA